MGPVQTWAGPIFIREYPKIIQGGPNHGIK